MCCFIRSTNCTGFAAGNIRRWRFTGARPVYRQITAQQAYITLTGVSRSKQNRIITTTANTLLSTETCPCLYGGTVAAAPPPFRPSEPALCGSCPLVTPYYCRLGDLLCFVFIVRLLCYSVIDVLYVSLQYFDTVGWVFWPVKTVSHITYTVLEGT